MEHERTLRITAMGRHGEGVAEGPRGPVYVPFTLLGETVRAAIEGKPCPASSTYDAAAIDSWPAAARGMTEAPPDPPTPICRSHRCSSGISRTPAAKFAAASLMAAVAVDDAADFGETYAVGPSGGVQVLAPVTFQLAIAAPLASLRSKR